MNRVTADEMRAVPQSRAMSIDFLFDDFDRLIQSPESVHRLRRFILDLAVRGKLVEQDPNDEPASELLKRIVAEKARLVKEGEIITKAPAPSGKPVEQDFLTPANWTIAKLADISNIVMGQSPQGETYNTYREGVPLINGPVEFSEGPFGKTIINQYTAAPTNCCNKGDFLICVRGSTTGRTNIAGSGACIGRGVAAIQPVFDDDFIRFFLWSMRKRIISMGRGAAFPSITRKQLETLPVPLPPLAEQHRIVAKVDELMALCDQLEAARAEREATRDRLATASLARLNAPDPDPATFRHDVTFALNNLIPLTARPDQIKALRQTILNLAVRGKLVPQDPNDEPASELLKRIAEEKAILTKNREIRRKKPLPQIEEATEPFPIPRKWMWTPLGNLCHLVTDGTHHTPRYIDKGVPFLSVKDVSSGSVDFSNVRHISEDQHRELCKRCCPEKGDILLTKVGTTGIAVPIKTDRSFSIFVSVALLKFSAENLAQDYLCHLLNSPFVRQQSKDNTQGIGNQNLVLRLINGFALPIPPLAEQRRIVAKVDELMALCDRLEASLVTGDETQGQLLQTLLHDALNSGGEVAMY